MSSRQFDAMLFSEPTLAFCWFIKAEWRIYASVNLSSLVQVMACLVAWPAPSHYLNQCSIIVNWTLANISQWKFNQNTAIFIEENAREKVVCEMASILSRPQCVKWTLGNKLQGNFNHHAPNVVYKMASICLSFSVLTGVMKWPLTCKSSLYCQPIVKISSLLKTLIPVRQRIMVNIDRYSHK